MTKDVNKTRPRSHTAAKPTNQPTATMTVHRYLHAPPVFHFDLLASLYLWEKLFLRRFQLLYLPTYTANPSNPITQHDDTLNLRLFCGFSISISGQARLTPRPIDIATSGLPQKFSCQLKFGQSTPLVSPSPLSAKDIQQFAKRQG